VLELAVRDFPDRAFGDDPVGGAGDCDQAGQQQEEPWGVTSARTGGGLQAGCLRAHSEIFRGMRATMRKPAGRLCPLVLHRANGWTEEGRLSLKAATALVNLLSSNGSGFSCRMRESPD